MKGEANGFDSKLTAVLMLPCIMAGIVLLFAAMPWLSPRTFQVNAGKPAYLRIMLVLLLGLAGLHTVTLVAAQGQHFNTTRAVLAGVCLLLAGMGVFLPGLPRN